MDAQHLLHIPAKHRAMVLCLLLFVCGGLSIAQTPLLKSEYSFRRYTTADGLPDLITASVFQDSKGFIWIGTYGGFARFDGLQFKNFDSKGMNTVGFAEDNGHIIAISPRASLCVTENDSISLVISSSSPSDTYCWRSSRTLPKGYGIYSLNNQKSLYAITDSGLVKTWEHELLDQMGEANCPYWDKPNRRFVIPTEKQGVYVVNENGTVEKHFEINDIINFIPYRNSFWAVGYDGLYEYKDNELNLVFKYPFFTGVSADIQLLEDSEHNLLIRTITHLYRYSKGKLETITGNLTASYNLFIDNEGNVWIATANGLFNYYKLNFQSYVIVPDGITSQAIVMDRQNRVWLPTLDGRLLYLENGKAGIMKYPASPTGYSYFERGSAIKDNLLYFSGGNAILRYDCDRNIFQWMPGIPPGLFQYMSVLPNGNLVAGNTTAAMIYSSENGIKRIYEAAELKQQILSSYVDTYGNILLGGVEGVTIINGDSIRYLDDEILKMCKYITCGKGGKLWLICGNKLVSMNDDVAHVEYTFKKDLCNLYITRSDMLIVTTNDELYLSPGTKHLDFIRYDHNNGYINAFTFPGFKIGEDAEGNIFIPTIEKVVSFHPGNLLGKLQPPKPYLQNFSSSANNIDWETFDTDNLKLDYRHNNIRFSYIGLSYASAQNVRYRYRLQGFQNEWSEPVKNREVTFNNLSPGDYVFEIYADSGTDESRSEIQSVAFSITPAFWQTAWFMVICIIFLILVGAGIAIYILQKKNRDIMEKLKVEKELNELRINSIRLKAIPHFNANVLSAIEYHIANSSKEDAMRILGIYSDYTLQTLTELDKAARPLNEELEYVKMYLDLEKVRFLDKFDFHIDVDNNVDKNVQLPNMILHTYCENAIKHGLMPLKTGGLLSIHVSQNDRMVSVSVEDNGVGRTRAALNPLLRSTKQGLSILSRQIEIYNRFNKKKINQHIDDLVTGDEQPAGTRFVVEIPLTFNYII